MTPEGKIKAKFNNGLKALQERYGNLMVRMPVTRGMGKPLLDYVLCANGRYIMVEAKRDANHEMTPQQKSTANECLKARGRAYVIYDQASINFVLVEIEDICLL